MTQWLMALVTKPHDLNLIPATHMVEGKLAVPPKPFVFHMYTHTQRQTFIHNSFKKDT